MRQQPEPLFVPKQPFMVHLSSSYYKYIFGKFGISHFYFFKVDDCVDEIDTSVPDGCIDLIFHYSEGGERAGADFYGTDLLPHSMKCYQGCSHFGVRFRPGVVPLLADASMPEMVDHIIPYEVLARYRELPEQIALETGFLRQIDCFLRVYKQCFAVHSMRQERNTAFLKDALIAEMIRSYGNLKVEAFAEKAGYSVSYIDKIFSREIGISPKRFSSIIRFQWLMNRLKVSADTRRLDCNMLASELGYYDQSHMIHDFKRYSKRTPLTYVNELCANDYNNRLKIIRSPSS